VASSISGSKATRVIALGLLRVNGLKKENAHVRLTEIGKVYSGVVHVSLEKPCIGLHQIEMKTCIAKPRGYFEYLIKYC
jgi:hypothetical protein